MHSSLQPEPTETRDLVTTQALTAISEDQ